MPNNDPLKYLDEDIAAQNARQLENEYLMQQSQLPGRVPIIGASPIQQQAPVIGQQQQRIVDTSVLPPNNPSVIDKLSVSDLALTQGDQMAIDSLDKRLLDEYRRSMPKPALERMGREEYFPGIDDPILKGTSSSKTLGSQPIFVGGGGYIPYNLLDARDRAVNEALKFRQEKAAKFDPRTPPITTDPRWQEKVSNVFFGTVNKYVTDAQKMYGQDWQMMLNDQRSSLGRKFAEDLDAITTLARETNQITDTIASIEKSLMEGSGTYSAQTLDLYQKYKEMIGGFEDGVIPKDFRKNLNLFTGSISLDEKLKKQILPELEREVNESWSQFADKGNFEESRKFRKETIDKGARKIAQQMKTEGGQYYGIDWVTEDMIYERLKAMMPDIREADIRTVSKPRGDGYETDDRRLTVQENKVTNFANFDAIALPKEEAMKAFNLTEDQFNYAVNSGMVKRTETGNYALTTDTPHGTTFATKNNVATGANAKSKRLTLNSPVAYDSRGNEIPSGLTTGFVEFIPIEYGDMDIYDPKSGKTVTRPVAMGYKVEKKSIYVGFGQTKEIDTYVPISIDTRNIESSAMAHDAGAALKKQKEVSKANWEMTPAEGGATSSRKEAQSASFPLKYGVWNGQVITFEGKNEHDVAIQRGIQLFDDPAKAEGTTREKQEKYK